jgi:hypothetical protein
VHYSWAEPELGLDFRGIGPLENFAPSRIETRGVDLGVIPLDLGGEWRMEGRDGRLLCAADISPEDGFGGCQETDDYGIPGAVKHFITERLEPAPSIFGALGGVWNVIVRDPSTGGCTAVLRDKTVTAHCLGISERLTGTITFTLNEGVGSGSSDEGLEVSAVRR